MAILKQSTAYTRLFCMVLTSDHITGATGMSPIVALSKAGAILTTAGGTVTEVTGGLGWYKVALTTGDTGTLGDLAFHCTATSSDPTDFVDQVTVQILGDTLTANTTQLAGQTVTATAGVSFASGFVASTGGSVTTITGNVNGNVGGNVTGSVGSVTAAVTVATAAQQSIADTLLDRDMSTGTDSGSATVRTPRQALRAIRNKWSISATTLTVTKEDDATPSWTSTVSTDATAVPIIGNDPAGP